MIAGCAPGLSLSPTPPRVYRVARLASTPQNPTGQALAQAFRDGMRDLGYVEGENLILEERYANDIPGLTEPAQEMVSMGVDVLLVSGASDARPVRAVTSTIPIVTAGAGDLLATELIASAARPGGNVTGLSTPSLAGRQMQLLQESIPGLSRLALLFDANNPTFALEPFEAAGLGLGLQIQFLGARDPSDFETIMTTAVQERATGLFVAGSAMIMANHRPIAEAALRHGLPTTWIETDAVGRGGLMAYGSNRPALFRRAAGFVDRILRGANPAEMPVERPTEFDFRIDMRTAQALGIAIPAAILAQATEVMQ
jgi:putative ABC transport system substrate-binding protein